MDNTYNYLALSFYLKGTLTTGSSFIARYSFDNTNWNEYHLSSSSASFNEASSENAKIERHLAEPRIFEKYEYFHDLQIIPDPGEPVLKDKFELWIEFVLETRFVQNTGISAETGTGDFIDLAYETITLSADSTTNGPDSVNTKIVGPRKGNG